MKSLLKPRTPKPMDWTPRASWMAAFAVGLVAGATALSATQECLRLFEQAVQRGVWFALTSSPDPTEYERSGEARALALELAQIQRDAERQLAGAEGALPPEARSPEPVAFRPERSLPPRIVRQVSPVYPAWARAPRIQGPVEVRVHVDERGNPARVVALSGNPMLQPAALAAARQWRFHPARRGNQPVPSDFNIRFEFKLA